MHYLDYVNIKMGTHSVPDRSCGNTLPLVAVPFGMNHFTVKSRSGDDRWFFHADDIRCYGIRLTHQPSPWIGDYASLDLLPFAGAHDGLRRFSSYDPRDAVFSPAYLKLPLARYGVTAELVPTLRGGVLRATWNNDPRFPADRTRRFFIDLRDGEWEMDWEHNAVRFISKQFRDRRNEDLPENFRMYGVLTFDAQMDRDECYFEDNTLELAFKGLPERVECRFATSFISLEVAEYSLKNEVGETSFEQLCTKAAEEWEGYLSKIAVEAEESVLRTFYSCMYRMFLFPRVFHEVCPDGAVRHFSPANGEICAGPMYTDNGFWDTYKTVYPLYSLILSEKYAEMCEGFLNFYKEGGWLPRWMSPCPVNCMPGTAIDAVFGDAAVKGVVTDGKMLREMLDSLLQHAENLSQNPAVGRDGLADYLELGYVSNAYNESVNKTLDYAYGDFCIGRLAEVYGDDDTAAVLLERAQNYRNLFDPETGFIRAKDRDGSMREDFTEFDWGGDYTEGGPWQCSFGIYHDLKGYADLLGGRKAFLDKIQRLFDTPPYFRAFGYNREIHEMSEMALLKGFGQLALSNQPSFHVPYLFSCMGDRDRTAYWVRKACAELFKAEPQGFPGDEDNGSMAGWYIFSALGFYPVCPGVDEYVIGSPCVNKAVITLDNGNKLTLNTQNEGVYASAITLNGETVETAYFKHADLKAGGTLTFALSDTPSGQEFSDEQLPYSMS